MKKRFVRIICLIMCVLLSVTAAACGKPEAEKQGSGKLYPITVHLYKGGFGEEWLKQLSAEFNELYLKDTDYEILYEATKDTPDTLLVNVEHGNSKYQLFINGENNIVEGIYKDLLADMSDIADAKVDGENNPDIKGKMNDYETWQSIYSKYGEGLYALPWDSSIVGLIFDHQLFVDNGYYTFATEADAAELEDEKIQFEVVELNDDARTKRLVFKSSENSVNYKEGDYILSKGQDDTFGTYDDGQPTTEAEFESMVKRIKLSGVYPFIWGGNYIGADYLNNVWQALFGQYEGEEDYYTFYKFDSNGKPVKFYDGTEKAITIKNGYEVQKMEGVKVAYEFFEKYFDYEDGQGAQWCHPHCSSASGSHFTGQDRFLLGYQHASTNPESAFLCDGNWWENEATAMFNTLEDAGRGKGDREYRFLVLPELPGQASEKSWFSTCNSGTIFMPKDSNTERLKITKEFVKYILKTENLSRIAAMSGYVFNYQMELREEDKQKLTPFIKNVYELYEDTDRIEIAQTPINRYLSPLAYASDFDELGIYKPVVQGRNPLHTQDVVRSFTIDEILSSFPNWNETQWSHFISQAQNSGFYTDVEI